MSESDAEVAEDYNSDDDEQSELYHLRVSWYQFNTNSFSVQVWDSFFALVVLENIIVTPLTLSFPDAFHSKE